MEQTIRRAFRTHVQRIDWSSRSVERETETFELSTRTGQEMHELSQLRT